MVIWYFDKIALTQETKKQIGGKAFGLHELQKISNNVPKWATLTTSFFDHEDPTILKKVWDALKKPLAVRSSAVDEDGLDLSFAGQMDSFLNVTDFSQFLTAIQKCKDSLFSERALSYRAEHQIASKGIKIAVIVQEMIESEVSGVVFTANPLNGKQSEMLISSCYGLGEGLVSGTLDADTFILDQKGSVIQKTIGEKTEKVIYNKEGGTSYQKVVPNEEMSHSLSPKLLKKLWKIAKKAEKKAGVPLDLEFGLAKGKLFLLQRRPITSLKQEDNFKVWDNSNIVESYSGVTTPLTFSFIKKAYFAVYSQFCETIGVPQKDIFKNRHVFENMLGLIEGRVYYNLINWYKLISLMPGFQYNKKFMEEMMGLRVTCESLELSPKRYLVELPRLIKVVCKMLFAHISLPKKIKEFHKRFDALYQKYSKLNFETMSPSELMNLYRLLEDELLWHWKSPITNDFEAMIFYGLLKKLSPKGLAYNDLLSGEGDIKSKEVITELIRLASEIKIDGFTTKTPEEALASLKQSSHAHAFENYLEKYGVRSINEMKLESIPIKDDPLFCIRVMQNYVKRGSFETKEEKIREQAEKQLEQEFKGSPLKRFFYRLILNKTRNAVKNRENQRFARTEAYSLVRTLIRQIGAIWENKEILSHKDDIFYLQLEEIFAFIEGTSVTVRLKELIALRKEEFASYKLASPDDRIETRGEVYHQNRFKQEEIPLEGDLLTGLAACSGTVIKEVKVVFDPDSNLELNGEILVAKQTDPGWVILFPSISGLIVEKGSMLSHSAIVAREMGIPAIVGVKGATTLLKSGDLVRLDGERGTIHIIRRA